MRIVSIVLVSLFIFSCSSSTAQQQKRPNVVLILVDDLGWTDLGSFGSDLHQSPNIGVTTFTRTIF